MTDTPTLPAPWRTVRKVPANTLPAWVFPVVYQLTTKGLVNNTDDWLRGNCIRGDELNIARYRPLYNDGSTGPLVERTTTVTREWSELPPNDGTKIAVLWIEYAVTSYTGQSCQKPADKELAWMLWSEWQKLLLTGPRTVHVPVTEEDWKRAMHHVDKVCYLNTRLASRATAPVVTGQNVVDAAIQVGIPLLYSHACRIAERITHMLAPWVAP